MEESKRVHVKVLLLMVIRDPTRTRSSDAPFLSLSLLILADSSLSLSHKHRSFGHAIRPHPQPDSLNRLLCIEVSLLSACLLSLRLHRLLCRFLRHKLSPTMFASLLMLLNNPIALTRNLCNARHPHQSRQSNPLGPNPSLH